MKTKSVPFIILKLPYSFPLSHQKTESNTVGITTLDTFIDDLTNIVLSSKDRNESINNLKLFFHDGFFEFRS